MADIQIDMFEVQLGAGILIQFAIPDEPPVRIVADAGVHASGYQADHVLRKLPASFRDFDPTASRTIDLMLGTHYDKDHLDGLVDIARDPKIHISEAWLPPVANDARPSFEVPLSDDDLLPNQLASKEGDRIFDHYLRIQRSRCEEALSHEREILSLTQVWESEDQSDEDDIGTYVRSLSELAEIGFPYLHEEKKDAHAAAISYFEHHCRSAEALIPGRLRGLHAEEFHLDETADDSVESAEFLLDEWLPFGDWMSVHGDPDWRMRIRSQPELARQRLTRLALIRRSYATRAITAASLNSLVQALMDRKIRIKSETIQAGQPEYFVWGRRHRRSFGRVSRETSESQPGPRLVLLGPSRQLVRKHRDLLPTARYLAAAMRVAIPIRSITPSNQLSYVVKLEHKGQSILITGDAGFVDFRRSRGTPYYPNLLAELGCMEVVQVAHHAGNNAHFYRVLLDAPFGVAVGGKPFLLLSHATHDMSRPTVMFERFVDQLENNGVVPTLVFTSEPEPSKIRSLWNLIHSQAGSTTGDRGDVRLVYASTGWAVVKHAIHLSQLNFLRWMNASKQDRSHKEHLLSWVATPGGTSVVGDDYALFSAIARILNEMGYDTVPPPPLKSFRAKREDFRREGLKNLRKPWKTNEDTPRGL